MIISHIYNLYKIVIFSLTFYVIFKMLLYFVQVCYEYLNGSR